MCVCSLGTWLAFGCHNALIADVHTDRWDLMVGAATGGREEEEEEETGKEKERRNEGLRKERGQVGKDEAGWIRRKRGKQMDG